MNNKVSNVSRPVCKYIQTAYFVSTVNTNYFYIVRIWLYLLSDRILMFV